MIVDAVRRVWRLLIAAAIVSVNADSYICESTKKAVTIDPSLSDNSLILPYATSETPEISVIIESYRDTKCGETINNLFKNAKNPKKLRIGNTPALQTPRHLYSSLQCRCN